MYTLVVRLFAQHLVMSASRRGSVPSPSISPGKRFDVYYNITNCMVYNNE